MAQNVQLPDGTLFPMREGETPEQALMAAASLYPDAFAPKPAAPAPQSGGIAALKAGVSGLKGDIAALLGRTGAIDPAAAERYIEEQKQYQAKTFKPTEEGWTQAPLTKFSELLGGSAAYMAAPLAAGVAAAALPVAAPTATVLGLGAAGAASFGQFTGSFLSRQMETGKKLGETDLGSATLAALPAAALDTISLRMIPGIRNLLGAAGREVTEAQAKEIAQQNLGRTFGDYVATTGKVAGVEGLTESAQQVLERLQAGLSTTDKEARDEYIESFLGGAVLGGTLSVPGRFYERGKIKDVAAEAEARDKQASRQALAAQQEAEKLEEEARRKTPEYLDDLEQRYAQLKAQERELTDATKGPVDKSDPLSVETRRRAQSELGTFKTSKEYKSLVEEYRQAYDDLLPRVQERQRQARLAAAPEGTQLDVFGEPAGEQDMSVPGQIKALNQYIGSFNSQIKAAQQAGDTQQVALLQQKQAEARDQIATLLPDPTLLAETKQRAEQRLTEYQTQIDELASQDELLQPQYQQLRELNSTANQIRQAIADMAETQKTVEKYKPTEVSKPVDKEAERARLTKKLRNQAQLGESVEKTLDQLDALDAVAEQPALFGEEDMREIKPKGLGDFIADERERVKALREKLDAERAALQRMATTPQTGTAEEVQRRRQELYAEAQKTAKELQQRNQDLYALEKKQQLLDKLLKEPRTPLTTQGIETLRSQIAALQQKLTPKAPKVAQPRTKLPAAAPEGEFAPRVTDAQLMEQRDRDIEALLDQFLPGALGVTPTQEVLQIQGPEGPREVRLTTLGGETNAALRKQLGDIQARRNNATEELFEVGGPAADALRSEIVMLSVTEAELRRKIDKLEPLSAEYRQDLQSLVRQAFTRAPAIPRSRTPNLAEQQYLDAVEELEAIQDETLDTIYAMNKLAYEARIKGIPGTTTRSWHYAFGEGPEVTKPGSVAELIQNNPVIQAGMQAQARVAAAQRRVDELAKRMPELPDLTNTDLDTKIDALIDEFSEGTPKELAAIRSKARRVPAAVRPPALLGADIPAQIAANDRQIEQLNQDIKFAGNPKEAEKIAALNQMKAERDRRKEENKRLESQVESMRGKFGKPFEVAPEETGEVAEMRQELATIERTLEAGTFKNNAQVTGQLEAARDELKGRIEAAVGPQRPEPEEAEGQREFLPAAGFPSTALAGRLKPVPAEDLAKARTAIVAATQKIEDIRKAAGRVSEMGEQYFREVATTYQQQIEKEASDTNKLKNRTDKLEKFISEYNTILQNPNLENVELLKRVPTLKELAKAVGQSQFLSTWETASKKSGVALPKAIFKDGPTAQLILTDLYKEFSNNQTAVAQAERRAEAMKEATAEVQRFLNLARLAGVSKKTNLRESLDAALDRALADKDKKEAALADLERKQRMYEQQEAARRGVDLGQVEAEKITAGEAEGFVSGRGKALAEKPKAKRSWIISKDSKAKVIKPAQSKTLQDAIQNAAELVGEARLETEKATEALKGAPKPEQIAPLKTALAKLENQINTYYNPAQAAELQAEIDNLKEQLAKAPVPPAVSNIAAEYTKATTAKKGLPASERVAQMLFETGTKEQKAAAQLGAAEQAVTAAENKVEASRKALEQAEKRLARLKDPKKIQGVKLQIGNLQGSAQKLRDNVLDAINARRAAEEKYMVARLERLLLNQQMGEHAKREADNVKTQLASAADTTVELQKQLDTAKANETKVRQALDASVAKFEKAEADAETARQAARNAERLAEEKARTDALDAAKAAQDRALALRTGLGLPGRRVTRDTAGQVMTAVQAEIRQRMATAETNLSKAIKAGNQADIRKYTAEVDATTKELAQVYGKAPVAVTEVGVEREAGEQPAAVEGMRLPARREGPSVRYVRGGSKAIMQSGMVKLRADGLSQEAAKAIGLYVAKNKIKGAKKDETRAALTKQFDALTEGMTPQQVDATLAEGKRLMGLGPTAELIAKRSAYQEALENFQTLERAKREAKTPLQKELAQDALEVAEAQRERASNAYDQAKALYETSQIKRAKTAEKNAVEALFDEEEIGAAARTAQLGKRAQRTAKVVETGTAPEQDEDTAGLGLDLPSGEDVAMVYTTATRTPADLLVQQAILDGRLLDALDRLSYYGANELIRQSARELRPLVMRTKVVIDPNLTVDGDAVPASYNPSQNAVKFRPTEINDENIIHEVTHAATMRVLTMPDDQLTDRQRNAKNQIKAIFKELKAKTDLATQYGLKDEVEFVSEVQSNVEFRAAIDSKPWYKQLWHAILRLFSVAPAKTLSERTEQLIREIYLPSAKIETAKPVASVFRTPKPQYESENALTTLADTIVAQPKTFKERMGSNLALEAEMNTVDMRAALQESIKRGAKDMGKDDLFTQAMYNVRKADQYMPLVYTSLSEGPPEYYTDEKGLRGIKSSNKDSAIPVFEAVGDVPVGKNTEGKFALATTYMLAQRAANKGLSKLDLGAMGLKESDLLAAMAAVNADPALKKALEEVRSRYNAYNAGLIKFLADSGKITKAQAKEWLKDGDYVPYYRVRDDGTAELVFGGEKTLTIGDIRTQPYLAELKGGETKILPLNESIIRNTMLITKAALYNNATKEIAYAMQEFGAGKGADGKNSMPIHKGHGPTGTDIIRFDQEPDPKDPDDDGKRWQRIKTENTAMEGIPSELVVKSLEGAHLTLPAFLKVGGIAGDWLRKGVTRMPPYIFRQLIRDPMAASFTGGLNYGPFRAVVMAGTEFLRTSVGQTQASKNLIEKGLIQSNLFTGDPDDMSTFATQLASGKNGSAIDRFLGVLDRAAIRADAATRSLVYDSARKNGLSEVEADMMTMESMNFYKRGLSPTVQYANRLIPFMNAQIQGLNVLVKAMRGNMPFEERQKIQRKFINNAFLLFGVGLVYAFAMDDDETFKNAKPRDKYSNFFVNVPGLGEAMKIPLPYESGWFFSAAVALVDAMKAETDNKQQLKALRDMFLSSVPGYSSMFMPQAIKPLLEVYTNKNFFSGQNIESPSMQNRDPEARFTASTTEAAKALAKVLPFSPVQIEHLARGYFGTAPIAIMAAASSLMRGEEKGEAPERRLSETPIIGSTFQRKYGGADADSAYAFAKEATQRAATLKDMQKTSTLEEQKEYLAEHRAEIKLAPMARNFETLMGRVRTQEALVRKRTDLNAEEKRKRLDELDRVKQDLADKFNAAIRKAGGP